MPEDHCSCLELRYLMFLANGKGLEGHFELSLAIKESGCGDYEDRALVQRRVQ